MSTALESELPPELRTTRRKKLSLADPSKLDRLPPHSIEAEQGVLGCVMMSPNDCLGECIEKFKSGAEVLYDLRHQEIFKVLLAMWEKKEAIDLITISQRLKDNNQLENIGGLAYLSSLPDAVPSAANLAYYADIVLEKFILRQIIKSCTEAISSAYDAQGDVFNILGDYEQGALGIRAHIESSKGNSDIRALCTELTADYQFAFENKDSRLPVIKTGLACWDRIMTLRPGYHLIGARPSVGKTSLLMQILRQAANDGFPAGMVSLETMAKNLVHRSIAAEAGVDGKSLAKGIISQSDLPKILAATQRICKNSNRLLIREEYGLTVNRFQAICRQLYQQGARIIGLDYFQRLQGRGTTAYEKATYASNLIKDTCLELQIPIIVLAQLGRDFDKSDREPRLSDLKSTGSLEEDAETVTFAWCSDEEKECHSRAVKCKVAKNKDEGLGSFDLNFVAPQFRFEEAPPQSKINPTDY